MTGTRASLLHALHQTLAAAGHDAHRCTPSSREHVSDGSTIRRRHDLNGGLRQARRAQSGYEALVDGAARTLAFRSAAQDHRVAGLQAQRARIGRHVGTALINDARRRRAARARAGSRSPFGPRPFARSRLRSDPASATMSSMPARHRPRRVPSSSFNRSSIAPDRPRARACSTSSAIRGQDRRSMRSRIASGGRCQRGILRTRAGARQHAATRTAARPIESMQRAQFRLRVR